MLHVIRSQGAGIYKFQLKPCELSYNTSSLLKHPLITDTAISQLHLFILVSLCVDWLLVFKINPRINSLAIYLYPSGEKVNFLLFLARNLEMFVFDLSWTND